MSERRIRLPQPLVVLLIVVAVGGGLWLWKEVIEDRVIPRNWGVVEAGAVYRSGQLHPALVERTLRDHGIRVVVSLGADDPASAEDAAEQAAAQALGIRRVVFPLRGDGTGDPASYVGAVAAMIEARRAGEPVLVHCAAGAQRTGGVVAAYRMLVEGEDPARAYDELSRYGWDPDDDRILVEYVNEHLPEIARGLVDAGELDALPDPLPVLGPAQR